MQAATPPSPDADKPAWRQFFQTRLAAQPPSPEDSASLQTRLITLLRNQPPMHIASFAAIQSEPDLSPLIESLPQHQWCFPRVTSSHLTFHHIPHYQSLSKGSFGILEPSPEQNIIALPRLDLVLCPGLGFGRDHSRLGRGGGFYDRLLAAIRDDAITIGIAFDSQIVEHVPTEAHDLPLDHILTPTSWIDSPPTLTSR